MNPGDLVKLDCEYESTPMFEQPSWSIPGVGTFAEGEIGTVLDLHLREGSLGIDWLKIHTPNGVGWVNLRYVKAMK